MALPKTIDRLDDVPELVRDHYAPKDGVLTLQLLSPDDHAALLKGLDSERGLRRDAEKQLSALKLQFEGIDPEEVRTLRERIEALKDKEVYDKDGLEALLARRTQQMKDEHARLLTNKDREIAQLRETSTDLDRKWRQDRIKTALLDAVTKAGVAKHATTDAVQRGLAVFTDLDEKGVVIAKQGEDIRYGNDGINPLTPDEWIVSLKPDAPHLWPPSSGGGAPQNHNGAGGVDYAKIASPTERLTAYRQAQGGKRG